MLMEPLTRIYGSWRTEIPNLRMDRFPACDRPPTKGDGAEASFFPAGLLPDAGSITHAAHTEYHNSISARFRGLR